MALYMLELYSTDSRSCDVRYRAYTRSYRRVERFMKVPRISFTDSGHGIVPGWMEVKKRDKPTIDTLADHVRKHNG